MGSQIFTNASVFAGVTGPYLDKGAEWTEIAEYFRGSKPRHSTLLQTGSRSTLELKVLELHVLMHSQQSFRVGSLFCHPTHEMSRVGGRASEGSEICTLVDQAPKCQFFFL